MLTTLTRDNAPTGHPHDPSTIDFDDTFLTPDACEQLVADEFEADGYRLAWWLNNDAGIDEPGASSLFDLKGCHPSDLSCGELLVRLLNGSDPAAIELLSRFRTHAATEVAREAQCRYDAQFPAGEGLGERDELPDDAQDALFDERHERSMAALRGLHPLDPERPDFEGDEE